MNDEKIVFEIPESVEKSVLKRKRLTVQEMMERELIVWEKDIEFKTALVDAVEKQNKINERIADALEDLAKEKHEQNNLKKKELELLESGVSVVTEPLEEVNV